MTKVLSIKDLARKHRRERAAESLKAPTYLRQKTKEWWLSVVNEFELSPHHEMILTLACESWDRCEQARELIKKHGLTFVDKNGDPRLRPEVGIERDNKIAFARLLRELALDISTTPDTPRPPAIKR